MVEPLRARSSPRNETPAYNEGCQGRSAVSISSRANGALGEHRRRDEPIRKPQAASHVLRITRW
jgi:hypothetical protein